MVREVVKEDLDALLDLYLFLHEDSIPDHDNHLEKKWTQIKRMIPKQNKLQSSRKMKIPPKISPLPLTACPSPWFMFQVAPSPWGRPVSKAQMLGTMKSLLTV